jgi:shikimate dehydrogenase
MKRFAVLGSPVLHSRSPVMHRAFFQAMNVTAEYEAIEVRAGHLADFLAEASEFDGFSVTMPLKEEAFMQAGKCDEPSAHLCVSNTLLRSSEGLVGLNTDVLGMRDLLKAAIAPEFDLTIIGAGATARAVIYAAEGLASSVTVINRSSHREDELRRISPELKIVPWAVNSPALDASVVVSTVPPGAADGLGTGAGILVDVVYQPWPTALAASWSGPVLSGLELLARQGAHQAAAFWPELNVDLEACYRVMLDAASAV